MRMRQKVCGRRYNIYARRNENDVWTDWTQTNNFDFAIETASRIKEVGFIAKIIDKKTKEVFIND